MAIEVAQISGDTVELLFDPDEEALAIGENLSIVDRQDDRGLIVQVIALKIVPPPPHPPPFSGGRRGSRQSAPAATAVAMSSRRTKSRTPSRPFASRAVAVAKIRKMIDSRWRSWDGWIPQRHAAVLKITDHEVLHHCVPHAGNPLRLGRTLGGADFGIDGGLMGRVNLIVSPQQSESAPLAMRLVRELVTAGTLCVIFDTQGLYAYEPSECQLSPDRPPTPPRLIRLIPGENLRLSVQQLGAAGLISLLSRFGLPTAAAMYFSRHVVRRDLGAPTSETLARPAGFLGMPALLQIAQTLEAGGESIVGGAIVSCLEAIGRTRLLADEPAETTSLCDGHAQLRDGGALVIHLSHLPVRVRRGLVQILVRLLGDLWRSEEGPALQRWPCMFFDDVRSMLTRGFLTDVSGPGRPRDVACFFVTAMVSDLDSTLLQRVEQLFIQRLASDQDGQHLARSGLIDAETLQTLARRLPGHYSLLIGETTGGYPIVFRMGSADGEDFADTSAGIEETAIAEGRSPPRTPVASATVAAPQTPPPRRAELPLFPEDIPTLHPEPVRPEQQARAAAGELAPPTITQISATWDSIVKRLSRRRRILETMLSTARPLRLTGSCVVLGFPPQQRFQQELIASEDYRRLIEDELKKAFGVELEVTTELQPA
jgi:hypothetical protein